jgi:hypothetical protein
VSSKAVTKLISITINYSLKEQATNAVIFYPLVEYIFRVYVLFPCILLNWKYHYNIFRQENALPELFTILCWHIEHVLSWYSTFPTRVQSPIEGS